MTKTMEIDDLIYELSQYDGELTVKVWIRGADKDYPITDLFIDCINEDGIYIDIDDRNLVDLSKIWHDASQEPKEHSKIVIVDTKGVWWDIDYASDDFDGCGLYGWEFCIAHYNLKIWAYVEDLLPKGGEK